MRCIEHIRKTFSRWPGALAISAGLAWTAAAFADRFPPDPVTTLREVLNTPAVDVKERNRVVAEALERIRTISDMRRALSLTEWPKEPSTDPLLEADRQSRNALAERFRRAIEAIFRRGSVTSKLAALEMIADIGTTMRGLDEPTGIGRIFTDDLINLMKEDDSPVVRAAAARTLGQVFPKPEKAGPAFRSMLKSSAVIERRAVLDGLLHMIQKVNDLQRGNQATQEASATDKDVIDAGREVFISVGPGLSDPDVEVRRLSAAAVHTTVAALVGLNLIPHRRISEDVIRIELTPEEVRRIRTTLRPLIEPLPGLALKIARIIGDPDPQVKIEAQRALEDLGNVRQRLQRLPPAATGLPPLPKPDAGEKPEGGEAPKQPAPEAKKGIGPLEEDVLRQVLEIAVPALTANISRGPLEVRLGAIEGLSTIGAPADSAAPELVKALRDPNLFVRWAAARTLGRIGPVEGVPAVMPLARLLLDNDLNVNLAAAEALGRYGPAARAAIPALVEIMRATDEDKRVAAIRSLQGIGTSAQSAIPALIYALDDPGPRVRQAAAELLGKFGSAAASAVPALRRLLGDTNPEVRQAASDALLDIETASTPR
jgi:HEAT repeat protein